MNRNRLQVLLALGATALCGVILFCQVVKHNNPERDALEAKRIALDTELVQKRAISKDVERFRREVDAIRERTKTYRALLQPKLAALRPAFESAGIAVTEQPPPPELRGDDGDSVSRTFVQLSGMPGPSLAVALELLRKSEYLWVFIQLQVPDAQRWSMSLVLIGLTKDLDRDAEKPRIDEASEDEGQHWYSWFNEDIQAEVDGKRAELSALDAQLGDLPDYRTVRRELERFIELERGMRALAPPLWAMIEAIFTAPEPILSNGALALVAEKDRNDALVGQGKPAKWIKADEVARRLGSGAKLVAWKRADGPRFELWVELLEAED